MKKIVEYFKDLRSNPNNHIGLGDVRITIKAQYDEGALFNVWDEQENFLFTIDTDGVVAN
jgi:hypothetical protein